MCVQNTITTPWPYSPCRTLAPFTTICHSSLLRARILQFVTPILIRSSLTSSVHLNLGLPTLLLPSGVFWYNLFTTLASLILSTMCVQNAQFKMGTTSQSLLYVYGSVHRWSILITVQRDLTQISLFIILQVHCKYFGRQTTPTIRSTQNCNYSLRYLSYFLCSYLPLTWPSLATLEGGSCTVPGAVVTVLCTADNGCGWYPKHVEWTCRIMNRLLCVVSRWTVINIQGESLARGPKLLSIKNYVIEIMTW